MCDKAVNTSISAIQFLPPKCYKIQKMCDKAADTCRFACDSVPDQYETQEMCHKVASNDLFVLEYSLNRYKTQKNM